MAPLCRASLCVQWGWWHELHETVLSYSSAQCYCSQTLLYSAQTGHSHTATWSYRLLNSADCMCLLKQQNNTRLKYSHTIFTTWTIFAFAYSTIKFNSSIKYVKQTFSNQVKRSINTALEHFKQILLWNESNKMGKTNVSLKRVQQIKRVKETLSRTKPIFRFNTKQSTLRIKLNDTVNMIYRAISRERLLK